MVGTPRRSDLQEFGETLRHHRSLQLLGRKDLAVMIGCDPTSLHYWEQGRNEPTDTKLVLLARSLDVPVLDLARKLPRYDYVDGAKASSRLTLARWTLRLTVEELSEQLGVSASVLRKWELHGPPFDRTELLESHIGPLGIDPPEPSAPRAGVVRYPGKKSAWILPLIPVTDTYVEPYGGSAAVLLARNPTKNEVYNDLNSDLTNLFRVLRSPRRARQLHKRLALTLYSREEYETALEMLATSTNETGRAWAMFVVLNQSWNGVERKTTSNWSTGYSTRRAWMSRISWVADWHERLATVAIEHGDALDVIRRYDSSSTTFYLDPPYQRRTRRQPGRLYRKEATDQHHEDLVAALLDAQGAVVLSGYETYLYRPLEVAGWERTDLSVRGRDETVWRNPTAVSLTQASIAS